MGIEADTVRVHHSVVIVGGGAAGIGIAAMLRRHRRRLSIAVIEPSALHAYQPGWTLVATGHLALERTLRPQASVMPSRVTWIRAAATRLLPDENAVLLGDGRRIVYGYLIVCPGLATRWDRIEGLRETLGQYGVCSVHSAEGAAYTWDCVRRFVGGVALFTEPRVPAQPSGAARSLLHLAAGHWQRRITLEHTRIESCLAAEVISNQPVPPSARSQSPDEYGIVTHHGQELVAIDGRTRFATFRVTDAGGAARTVRHRFDMIHVTPPREPHDIVRHGPLADASGRVAVDPVSLRHVHHANVFALGDAIGVDGAGTLAATRLQVQVAGRNLLALLDGKPMTARYDAAAVRELPVGPGLPWRGAGWLGTRVPPAIYWNRMLRGRPQWIRQKT